MLRSMLRGVMLFALLTLPPAVMAARTYNIQTYPDLQKGWTLSGTITTDGTIGTIQATNILSWTWTGTTGVSSWTVSSTDPGTVVYTGGVTATGAGLFLTYGIQSIDLGVPGGAQMFLYATSTAIGFDDALGNYQDSYTTWTEQPGSTAWQIASASPAAVPEPSSLHLVGFGAVCVYVMGHKRRARRTATTDV